jgi:hypothetical protein
MAQIAVVSATDASVGIAALTIVAIIVAVVVVGLFLYGFMREARGRIPRLWRVIAVPVCRLVAKDLWSREQLTEARAEDLFGTALALSRLLLILALGFVVALVPSWGSTTASFLLGATILLLTLRLLLLSQMERRLARGGYFRRSRVE